MSATTKTTSPEVVIGLDGSRSSRHAFRAACVAARNRGAKLVAYHSVYMPVVFGRRLSKEAVAKSEEYGHAILDEELASLEDELGDDMPEVEREVWAGHVYDGFDRLVSDPERNIELVVLGSRGLGGFAAMTLGSVSTYAVSHLPVPVLIVPNEDDYA